LSGLGDLQTDWNTIFKGGRLIRRLPAGGKGKAAQYKKRSVDRTRGENSQGEQERGPDRPDVLRKKDPFQACLCERKKRGGVGVSYHFIGQWEHS